MKEFNERQRTIIVHLVSRGKTKGEVLARLLQVSDKTVRNEIRKINMNLKANLIDADQEGFYIQNQDLGLLPDSFATDSSSFNNNYTILQHILLASEPANFDVIADRFNYSSSALQNKVKDLNAFASSYHVVIKRKNNALVVEGSEYNKRRLFLSIIYQETDFLFHDIHDYQRFFPQIKDIDREAALIMEAINYFDCHLPSYYETNLFINIFASLSIGTPLEDEKGEGGTEGTPEEKIAQYIIEHTGIECNDFYIKIVASTLQGIVVPNHPQAGTHGQPKMDYDRKKIEELILSAFQYYSISIDFSRFLPIFTNHILVLLRRLKTGNSCFFSTPFSIKDSSVFIYDVAVYFCMKLSDAFQVLIPESEISLISIHIGFAVEAASYKDQKIFVSLYASNYSPVEKYIVNKINMEYENQIQVTTVNNAATLNAAKTDLLITTQPMIPNGSYEYCQITPLLTEKDKVNIQMAISNIVEKRNLKEFFALARRCFDRKLFFYEIDLDTRDIVLKFLDLHLQLQGAVDTDFLPSVLKREEMDDTCFMNTFALPHAFDSNALQSKIAILINPNGIQWGRQKVNFVFFVALNKEDKSAFRPLFDGLASVLSNQKKLLKLNSVTNFEEFMKLLEY